MVQAQLLIAENSPINLTEKSTILSSWLHITDRCNLRCNYCFLPHENNDMSLEMGLKIIDSIFNTAIQHQYPTVKIKYAGGEPLLNFPLINQLQQYAKTLAEQSQIKLDSVILSNGTLLTTEIIQQIQTLNLRLMISLDGLGKYHDQQRHYCDGKTSSQQVLTAIELALNQQLIPDISITVSQQSVAGLPELMSWILARDLPFSLNFYRENDFAKNQIELHKEEQTIIDGLLKTYQIIEQNLPARSLLASLLDRTNLASPHLRTCTVGNSYLVFNHHGEIAKCQMQKQQIVATIQDTDILRKIQQDKMGIQNLSVTEKVGCRDCEWKYWCTGGCPLATYRVTGRYDVQSPNCHIYKALYPEVLRLEGLRLLKYYAS